MKNLLLLFLMSFGTLGYAITISDYDSAAVLSPKLTGLHSINEKDTESYITFLADDALRGRLAGSNEGVICSRYLASQFQLMGISPLLDDYYQEFQGYLRKEPHVVRPMQNVLARIPGSVPHEMIVVGAHYDHLGVDPTLTGDSIYNGADDNASGVDAILQIARAFMLSGIQPKRTLVFALWDGEEQGLLGSRHFVESYDSLSQIKGYLNFDMIGRNNDENNPESVDYFYSEDYPHFLTWLEHDIQEYNLALNPIPHASQSNLGGSDNSSFGKKGIPIIWYHTNAHPDFHKPSDHADKINIEKCTDITRAAYLNV